MYVHVCVHHGHTVCIGVPVYNIMGESASVPIKEAQCHTTLFGGHLWKERKRTSQGNHGDAAFTFVNTILDSKHVNI